ncbi:hypothetical protein [Parasphingorhabdus pacifica]
MDTTTDAPHFVRSRRSNQPDPAKIWAPLAGLTEAAAQAASTSGSIAITRGFDRHSRQRAKALRDLLNDRGVAAIEVTPAPGSSRLLDGTEIAALVNLIGSDSWQPFRLAASLRAPVLLPSGDEDGATEVSRRDVITLTGENDKRDIALSHVAVRPEDPTAGSITITSDGEPLAVPGGNVTLEVTDGKLRVHLSGPDFAEQTFTAEQVRVETSDVPHRIVRDELPIAEFEGSLVVAAEQQGLVVRPV